MCCCTCLFL